VTQTSLIASSISSHD